MVISVAKKFAQTIICSVYCHLPKSLLLVANKLLASVLRERLPVGGRFCLWVFIFFDFLWDSVKLLFIQFMGVKWQKRVQKRSFHRS